MPTIAHLSDIHLDDELSRHYRVDARARLAKVLEDVARRGIAEAVITGDLGDDKRSVESIASAAETRNVRCRFALGNHDSLAWFKGRPEHADRELDGKLAYRFAVGGAEALVLDSSSHALGDEQLALLGDYLSGRDEGVVFCHHPVLDCGGTFMDGAFPLRDRAEAEAALRASGKRVRWFCGHYHNEYRVRSGPIVQHVTTSTSVRLKAKSAALEMDGAGFGYRIVELGGDEPSTESVWLS